MPLRKLLDETEILLADGATGTGLFGMGLPAGAAPEEWSLSEADKIRAHHRAFVDAGVDIILTNTFGGTHCRLKLHGLQDRAMEVNRVGAALAREVADRAGRTVVVAGAMGPTGELLAPIGALSRDACMAAFAEQAEGLKAGGADVAWIETMSAAEEMQAAAEAAIAVGLPYVYTASFDTAGRTMMGLAPQDLHRVQDGLAQPAIAFGANCGVGASDLLLAILAMPHSDHVLVAKANCGIPQVRGDSVVYSGTPDLMVAYTGLAADAGARIIGGCCGAGPAHLTAMRRALDNWRRGPRPGPEQITAALGPPVAPPAPAGKQPARGRRAGRRRD